MQKQFSAILIAFAFLTGVARGGEISFSRDVRPILAANCLTCHGPDAKERKANLRLDTEEALKPADKGVVAIVPGKPDASELIKRITSSDPDFRMPHVKSKRKPLSAEQVAVLRQWIEQGAKFESHWAFAPVVRPALPKGAASGNPIDAYVVDRLHRENLSLSPQADKVTLLRRLSLDLIGLPPTIAEVDAFVADASPDAYQKQVERLLASPHYGERWGRHWLDAARYADSDGFEKDKLRYVWFYRDWVINAFNRDLPYNQFIIEQFAGDQLPHPTQDQIVATGFLRNSMLNEEGGVDPEQFRMDEMFDRMDVIGKSILGLTINCSQCHNHKYDPFSQADYYRLFAFLNNDDETCQTVYTTEQRKLISDIRQQIKNIEAQLKKDDPNWHIKMDEWEHRVHDDQPDWHILNVEHIGEKSQRYIHQVDGSLLAQGYAPTRFVQVFEGKSDLHKVTAFRLELLNDPNLPCGGPGRSTKGLCALSEFSVEAWPVGDEKKKIKAKFVDASSDFDQPARDLEKIFDDKTKNHRITGPAKFAIDGDGNTAWGIDAGPGRRNQPRKAVFVCDKPIGFDGDFLVSVSLTQKHGGWNSDDNQNNNLGRFRLSITSDTTRLKADPIPKDVRELMAIQLGHRTVAQTDRIFSYWRTTVPEWKQANEQIETLWAQYPEGVTQLTLRSRNQPRETHMLTRGDWLKPNVEVQPGVPACLNALPADAPPTRLTFAHWLVDRQAPTTARVFVNRIWQEYFGIGLVGTSEDFGTQGEHPSHRELIDWLAAELMEPAVADRSAEPNSPAPWSIKHIHRLIVSSQTYQQRSAASDKLLALDPYNRLLARGPRQRVDGEVVHDIALAASGLLNTEVGGRPLMPPAPAFLFLPPTSYGPFPWIDETGSQKYRRAVYTFRRRSTPFPMLQTFDVPNGDAACIRRARSNSPMQALVSLNEPTFVECAQALARKTLAEGGNSDVDRMTYAFRRVLSRTPDEVELKQLLALLDKERSRFAEGWQSPSELAGGKPGAPAELPAGMTPTQVASWTIVSRVLLNLDETITKE